MTKHPLVHRRMEGGRSYVVRRTKHRVMGRWFWSVRDKRCGFTAFHWKAELLAWWFTRDYPKE